MAITMFSRLLSYRVPTSAEVKALTATKVPVTSAPSVPVPVPVMVKPTLNDVLTQLKTGTPYLPSIAPRVQPVTYPAPISQAAVVAPEPEPLVPHKFSTCATCGEEKVTEASIVPVAAVTAEAPTPAAPAPTPAPATPTAQKKASGWALAFAVVLLVAGGLALASYVRPRK